LDNLKSNIVKEPAMDGKSTPFLFPCDPEEFWGRLRMTVREELERKFAARIDVAEGQVRGLVCKP
jgi:hypothetical protein